MYIKYDFPLLNDSTEWTIRVGKLLMLSLLIISCALDKQDFSTADHLSLLETQQIDALLDDLYTSFSYEAGQEPDWDLLHSTFASGGQFVSEVAPGQIAKPQSVQNFIDDWKSSLRSRKTESVKTTERILEKELWKMDKLIFLNIKFIAKKSSDRKSRRPGLDSLVLIKEDGNWKILSFIVQYESKLMD